MEKEGRPPENKRSRKPAHPVKREINEEMKVKRLRAQLHEIYAWSACDEYACECVCLCVRSGAILMYSMEILVHLRGCLLRRRQTLIYGLSSFVTCRLSASCFSYGRTIDAAAARCHS